MGSGGDRVRAIAGCGGRLSLQQPRDVSDSGADAPQRARRRPDPPALGEHPGVGRGWRGRVPLRPRTAALPAAPGNWHRLVLLLPEHPAQPADRLPAGQGRVEEPRSAAAMRHDRRKRSRFLLKELHTTMRAVFLYKNISRVADIF